MSDQVERLSAYLAEGLREATRVQRTPEKGPLPQCVARLADLVQESLAAHGPLGLAHAIREAIALLAERVDHVSLAVTGPAWVGGGVPAVERVLAELIASAQQEIMLTAYSITSGSDRIWVELERVVATGIRVTAIINRLSEQHDEARSLLYRLANAYAGAMSLFSFGSEDVSTDLHAKVLVVDRKVAVVGSANLSLRGMVTAHEMATVVRGPTADRIAGRLDALLRSPWVIRVG